jgi:competence protein ComGC
LNLQTPLRDVERAVFALVTPERSVADIIDRARIGEFATTCALATLVQRGYLYVQEGVAVAPAPDASKRTRRRDSLPGIVVRLSLHVAVAIMLGVMVRLALARTDEAEGHVAALQDTLGHAERARISREVEAFRIDEARLPASLAELVDTGAISEDQLKFPYKTDYIYTVRGAGWSIELPLR